MATMEARREKIAPQRESLQVRMNENVTCLERVESRMKDLTSQDNSVPEVCGFYGGYFV